MKTLIFSDIHLKRQDQFGELVDTNGMRIEVRSVNKIKRMASIIKSEKPDNLIIAGDLFDSNRPPEYLRALFFKEIPELTDVFIIAGNHDISSKFPVGVSESYAFKNVVIVPAGNVFKFDKFTLVGWTRDKEVFHKETGDYLIGHGDFPLGVNFNHILMGHNHKHYQEDRFWSIGSLFKDSWAEEDFKHYYVVVKDGIEFKENEDLKIKTFNSLETSGSYDAIRFKIKGKPEFIYSIDQKKIKEEYKCKVFFDFEIEEQQVKETMSIEETIKRFLASRKLTKEQIEFGKNYYNLSA